MEMKIYNDPTYPMHKPHRKSRKYLRYHLGRTFFCDENGDYVTLEQISNPKYDPWIKCYVNIKDIRDQKKNPLRGAPGSAYRNEFYYYPKSDQLFRKIFGSNNWVRLKSSKKRWKKLIEEILTREPQVWKPFRGNSTLSTGFIYTPYIPVLVTPTVLDPNSFTPSKGIMIRYAKKFVTSNQFGISSRGGKSKK